VQLPRHCVSVEKNRHLTRRDSIAVDQRGKQLQPDRTIDGIAQAAAGQVRDPVGPD
jgi:hypothetical protein